MPPTGDLAHKPGMCPDWESNQQLFGSQSGTQTRSAFLSNVSNRLIIHKTFFFNSAMIILGHFSIQIVSFYYNK